jgi:hypothetical protein
MKLIFFNLNNDNVLGSNLKHLLFFFFNCINGIQKQACMFFFQINVMIAQKAKFLILFTSPINII